MLVNETDAFNVLKSSMLVNEIGAPRTKLACDQERKLASDLFFHICILIAAKSEGCGHHACIRIITFSDLNYGVLLLGEEDDVIILQAQRMTRVCVACASGFSRRSFFSILLSLLQLILLSLLQRQRVTDMTITGTE